MLLYINAAVSGASRTDRLARALLGKLGGEFTELKLRELELRPLDKQALEKRTHLVAEGCFSDSAFALARQFAAAEEIVIGAPYWDISFPALLKEYIENICVMGIASTYDEDGTPRGLCRAKRLWYVTTAGGPYLPDFSYGQIKALCSGYFGIPETQLVYAEKLDIFGNDPEKIITEAIASLSERVGEC